MSVWARVGTALLVALSFSVPAFAQGGGASSTGTIQGRVADAQGAVLPGVTVTATSPALIQPQTTVTSETGNYRFPAVPPGAYELTFELAGFNTLKRSGIAITLGFTANVNVELALATLQETVTVSGASPVIDTSATRIQQNFKMEQLQSIPNGRDMWALLAVNHDVHAGHEPRELIGALLVRDRGLSAADATRGGGERHRRTRQHAARRVSNGTGDAADALRHGRHRGYNQREQARGYTKDLCQTHLMLL